MDLETIAKHIKQIDKLLLAKESAEKAIQYHSKLIGMEGEIIPQPPVGDLSNQQLQLIRDWVEQFKYLYPHKLLPKFPENTIGLRTDR